MKCLLEGEIPVDAVSLPTRGAWIEIYRKTSCGVPRPSLPTRGAWIEIAKEIRKTLDQQSLPTRGAWIEIMIAQLQNYPS